MRKLLLVLLLLASLSYAGFYTSEGGNVTELGLNGTERTIYWAGITGWMDPLAPFNPNYPIGYQPIGVSDIDSTYANGTWYGLPMIVTRSGFKPELSDIRSPTPADISTGGMFDNFTNFYGKDFTTFVDSPLFTFVGAITDTCTLGNQIFSCPRITLVGPTPLWLLVYDNGTHQEPVFVSNVTSTAGYNGTSFDFQYMVPVLDNYFFYIYPEECNITVWIDGTQTTTYPKTGVPYEVDFLVTYNNSAIPIPHALVRVTETNGRNLLYPNLYLGRNYSGRGYMFTNPSGNAVYALSPTRYNIPDSYNYETYVEVIYPAYCRQNMSVAIYNYLEPTYRSSLVNPSYGSQVKTSVQNMNSIASTASKWISAGKARDATFTVRTDGTVVGALPTLKVGAPNIFNITILDSGNPVNGTVEAEELDGLIIYVPAQPEKELYNNTGPFPSNETFMLMPTRYNNNANLTFFMYYNNTNFANITFTIDSVLEDPQPSEMTMDDPTNALIGSALQNINQVLSNIGKSISTV